MRRENEPMSCAGRSAAALEDRMRALGSQRLRIALTVGADEPIAGSVLIALADRKSGLRNVLGDYGRARGAYQLDDAHHALFLRSSIGCLASSGAPDYWRPAVPQRVALAVGCCPRWVDATRYCARVLLAFTTLAQLDGLAAEDVLPVAVAAFDCGYRLAMLGNEDGDPDKYTTGGDFGSDVLRRSEEIAETLKRMGIA